LSLARLTARTARPVARLITGESSGGAPPLPVVTEMLFDEDFSVPRTIVNQTAGTTPTSTGIGFLRAWNAGGTDVIASGVLTVKSANLILADGATHRNRNAGRCHYLKFTTAGRSTWLGLAETDNGTGNWWILGSPSINAGFYWHELPASGSLRDIRNYNTSPVSNFISKAIAPSGTPTECVLLERGVKGTAVIYNIADAGWVLGWVEDTSERRGVLSLLNSNGSSDNIINRILSCETDFSLVPLVQHSFASVVGPSDGAGQVESGGDGVAAESFGSTTITANRLSMSADGSGFAVFDCGESEWHMHVKMQVYDGSPCGVVLRWVDSANYLFVELDSTLDRLRIVEVVSGTPATLATQSFNPGPVDTHNVADGAEIQLNVSVSEAKIIASLYPGALHDTYVQATSERFATATKCGAYVSKGAAVNSANARDMVVFARNQVLPVF